MNVSIAFGTYNKKIMMTCPGTQLSGYTNSYATRTCCCIMLYDCCNSKVYRPLAPPAGNSSLSCYSSFFSSVWVGRHKLGSQMLGSSIILISYSLFDCLSPISLCVFCILIILPNKMSWHK